MDALIAAAVAGSVTLIIKFVDVLISRRRAASEEKVFDAQYVLAQSQASEADARSWDIYLKRTDEWASKMERRNNELDAKIEQMQKQVDECVTDRKLLLDVVSANNLVIPPKETS